MSNLVEEMTVILTTLLWLQKLGIRLKSQTYLQLWKMVENVNITRAWESVREYENLGKKV
jgi:hypothetical protein